MRILYVCEDSEANDPAAYATQPLPRLRDSILIMLAVLLSWWCPACLAAVQYLQAHTFLSVRSACTLLLLLRVPRKADVVTIPYLEAEEMTLAATTAIIPETGKLGRKSNDKDVARTRYTIWDKASLCAKMPQFPGYCKQIDTIEARSSDTLALRLGILWEKWEFAFTRDVQSTCPEVQ